MILESERHLESEPEAGRVRTEARESEQASLISELRSEQLGAQSNSSGAAQKHPWSSPGAAQEQYGVAQGAAQEQSGSS